MNKSFMSLSLKYFLACLSRKSIISCLLLCLLAINAQAQLQETTDKITISELTVAPGGDAVYFDVSLSGSSVIYTAYEVTLQLPVGLEVDYNKSNILRVSLLKSKGLYPYSTEYEENEEGEEVEVKNYTHTVAPSFSDGKLKVMCYSSINEDFTSASGDLFRVYVKASPYMKPGEAKITSTDVIFSTSSKVGYSVASAEFPVSVSATSVVPVSVSSTNQWGSCVLPFAADKPDGVTAYTYGSEDGDYIVLSEASSLEAYRPYLLYAENGYSGTLTGDVDATKYQEVVTDGLLNGALVRQQVTDGYVMQNKGNGVKFYNVNGQTFSIPAGRCWLSASESGAKQSYGFAFQTDGIEDVKTTIASSDAEVYSLDGRRISNPQSGCIYIIGGKKVLKK